jgi:hypothetical protein
MYKCKIESEIRNLESEIEKSIVIINETPWGLKGKNLSPINTGVCTKKPFYLRSTLYALWPRVRISHIAGVKPAVLSY